MEMLELEGDPCDEYLKAVYDSSWVRVGRIDADAAKTMRGFTDK